MGRNLYVDLLRVIAIGGVVYGHWLLVSITYRRGWLSGVDAIGYLSWAPWVTWAFQVMPVFFLVGGYANARSWPSHHARGETWTEWARDRALRPKSARQAGSSPFSCGSCPSTCCWAR